MLIEVPYSENLVQEETFASHTILFLAEIFVTLTVVSTIDVQYK